MEQGNYFLFPMAWLVENYTLDQKNPVPAFLKKSNKITVMDNRRNKDRRRRSICCRSQSAFSGKERLQPGSIWYSA
jgi:hypothetical protein